MSDPTPSQSLSEIGHLFLSSVRDRHTNGAPRPVRRPPGSPPATEQAVLHPAVADGLTQEEQALVQGVPQADEPELIIPPVTAVIAGHLGASQLDRAIEYAKHLARDGQRIGLIEVDGSVFRLMCFDCPSQGPDHEAAEEPAREFFDARAMTAAIEELSWDLDRWLLVLPNPRGAESRNLLRACPHWVLLSTCDHDGVVSGYRLLKGLQEPEAPRLSLALLEPRDDAEADQVHRKIAGVCEQFLGWALEAEPPVGPSEDVAEHAVMLCQPTRSKAELAIAPQWQVVADFLARAKIHACDRDAAATAIETGAASEGEMNEMQDDISALNGFDKGGSPATPAKSASPTAAFAAAYATGRAKPESKLEEALPPAAAPTNFASTELPARDVFPAAPPLWPRAAEPVAAGHVADVIDLPDASASAGSILTAVLRNTSGGLVECPVTAPMCPEARLAVNRDRGLVLLAVARQGLGEIRAVGRAYAWVVENIALIRMAVPQLSVDVNLTPRLRLLVDHADLTADVLQPMLRSETVAVQSYRRLRWGSKTGLLLEAA